MYMISLRNSAIHESMIRAHREAWCWVDLWSEMTEEMVRPLELSQIHHEHNEEVRDE